jgi:hypothetical protein
MVVAHQPLPWPGPGVAADRPKWGMMASQPPLQFCFFFKKKNNNNNNFLFYM